MASSSPPGIAERAYEALRGPVWPLAVPDASIQFAPGLETAVIPDAVRIMELAREVVLG